MSVWLVWVVYVTINTQMKKNGRINCAWSAWWSYCARHNVEHEEDIHLRIVRSVHPSALQLSTNRENRRYLSVHLSRVFPQLFVDLLYVHKYSGHKLYKINVVVTKKMQLFLIFLFNIYVKRTSWLPATCYFPGSFTTAKRMTAYNETRPVAKSLA